MYQLLPDNSVDHSGNTWVGVIRVLNVSTVLTVDSGTFIVESVLTKGQRVAVRSGIFCRCIGLAQMVCCSFSRVSFPSLTKFEIQESSQVHLKGLWLRSRWVILGTFCS